MKSDKHYCYLITNKINNKVYVGVTSRDIAIRFKDHVKVSRMRDNNKKTLISRAIHKYGEDNFIITVIEEFETAEQAYEAEDKYIKLYNSLNHDYGYNNSNGGHRGPSIIKHTRETVLGVINDYLDGYSLNKIGEKYNIKKHSVFDITRGRISKKHNIPKELIEKLIEFKEKSNKKKRMTVDELNGMVKDFIDGEVFLSLKNKYGYCENTIWNAINRNTNDHLKLDPELEIKLKEKLKSNRYWSKTKKVD